MAFGAQTSYNIGLDKNIKDIANSSIDKKTSSVPQKYVIPEKQMQTYNVKVNNPSSKYVGLEKEEEDYIEENLNNAGLEGIDRKIAQEDIYKKALQTKQSKAFLKDREQMRQKLLSGEINIGDKNISNKLYKSSQFADIVRELAISSGKQNVAGINDDEVIKNIQLQRPGLYDKFISGEIDAEDLPYELKGEKKPKSIKDTIKNIGEGVVSFAGGIPKVVAEFGVLDKTLQSIGEKIGEKIGKEFKPKQSFSEFAGSSQVGGDNNSTESKATEYILDALELATGVASLKAGAKYAAKQTLKKAISESLETGGEVAIKQSKLDKAGKTVLNIIKESDISKELKGALPRSGLNEQRKGFIKWLLGTGKKVKPSQKSIDAAATVSTEIAKPSKLPGKLYTQVSDKVGDIAGNLGDKLKNIPTKKASQDTISKLDELATEIGDYSPAMKKATQNLIDKVSSATNLDEVRNARKIFDDVVGKNVKLAKEGKSKILKSLWGESRSMVNNYIDEVANGIEDVGVKGKFKIMSNLYHALGQIDQNIVELAKPTKGVLKRTGETFKEALKYGAGGAVAGYVINKATGK